MKKVLILVVSLLFAYCSDTPVPSAQRYQNKESILTEVFQIRDGKKQLVGRYEKSYLFDIDPVAKKIIIESPVGTVVSLTIATTEDKSGLMTYNCFYTEDNPWSIGTAMPIIVQVSDKSIGISIDNIFSLNHFQQ